MSSIRKKERLFRFKQFSVRHEKSGMKVGTDGVLLGAWADIKQANQILDIGTGSGVIALMLAQRTSVNTYIDAVEIDQLAYEEAQENIKSSPWSNRVSVFHTAIQDFKKDIQYDLIISNPPYFINSSKPPDSTRTAARHTENLPFEDLLIAVEKFLKVSGTFNIILPTSEGERFNDQAKAKDFNLARKWTMRSRKEKTIERLLLEFSKRKVVGLETGEINLYDKGENWSDEYRNLTRDFYLKL